MSLTEPPRNSILKPYALNVFPTGSGKGIKTVEINLSNPKITMTALKKSETEEDAYIARFYNGSGSSVIHRFHLRRQHRSH